jgi:hypothetical protein
MVSKNVCYGDANQSSASLLYFQVESPYCLALNYPYFQVVNWFDYPVLTEHYLCSLVEMQVG